MPAAARPAARQPAPPLFDRCAVELGGRVAKLFAETHAHFRRELALRDARISRWNVALMLSSGARSERPTASDAVRVGRLILCCWRAAINGGLPINEYADDRPLVFALLDPALAVSPLQVAAIPCVPAASTIVAQVAARMLPLRRALRMWGSHLGGSDTLENPRRRSFSRQKASSSSVICAP